ncbi:MAG: hypothetical protein DME77_00130 [Verrucomicrobia bacterium]|nr:MAG: hypothetical protein DME77_00130 [Verrucomicrobiota bacterium]
MTKLGEWLKEQGLEQYAGVFADNDIDFDVLSDLAETDLEKLGLSLGHRRKLLRALAALQPAPTQPETSPRTPEIQEAERRQVTVLFSDLVGSTALATPSSWAMACSPILVTHRPRRMQRNVRFTRHSRSSTI